MIYRYFAPIIAIPVLLSLGLIATAQKSVPPSIQPCVSKLNTEGTPVERVVIDGKYQEGARTYYLLTAFPPQSDHGWDAVMSSDRSGCVNVNLNPMGDAVPATAFLPLSVARGLTLNTMKSTIQRLGGPQKYQAFLIQAAQQSGNQLFLMPYEVSALDQLGIQLPGSIKVVTPK